MLVARQGGENKLSHPPDLKFPRGMACPPHAPPPVDAIHTFNRTQYDGGIRYVTEPAVYCHRCQDHQKYGPHRVLCAGVPVLASRPPEVLNYPVAIYVFYIKIPRGNLLHGRLDPAFPQWQYASRVHVLAPVSTLDSRQPAANMFAQVLWHRSTGVNTWSFPGCVPTFKGSR